MDSVHQTCGSSYHSEQQISPGGEISSSVASRLVNDIHNMCKNVCQKRPSIYRVPEHLRKLNENAYTPWHVAIGPYHHKSHKYTIMEEHKMVYTKSLIRRRREESKNNKFEEVTKKEIDDYVKEVEKLELKSRLNYAEKIKLRKEEFVKMLLIDGCFIVEFLCRKIKKLAKFEDEAMNNFGEMYKFIGRTYDEVNLNNDFILKSTRTAFEVRRDLTLLENQLPYFVLENLFNFTFSGKSSRPNFKAIVYCAFRTSIPNISHILNEEDIAKRIELEPETTAHFVSFLKSCCGPVVGNNESNAGHNSTTDMSTNMNTNNLSDRRINMDDTNKVEFPCLCNMKTHEIRVPSASVLAKSGVVFESMDGETPMLHMDFDDKKGVLKLPVLILWHHTETFFRNVMAYELYNHTANYSKNVSVSDYMCFMDDLINSKEDVAVLVKSGIIQNWLESDEVVTDLFNSITKHILADYSSYSDTCKDMNKFRKKYNIRQLKAVLKQDYFNQPWAVIYFITGVILQTTASIIEAVISVHSVQESKGDKA